MEQVLIVQSGLFSLASSTAVLAILLTRTKSANASIIVALLTLMSLGLTLGLYVYVATVLDRDLYDLILTVAIGGLFGAGVFLITERLLKRK